MSTEVLKTKAGELPKVDPRNIASQEGLNVRIDFDLPDLKESIRKNGIMNPIVCYKLKGIERYIILSGERRMRAIHELMEEDPSNENIKYVPVVCKIKPTDIEINVGHILYNDGKPLLPMELAETYKRLIALGMTITEISEKIGKSYTHVNTTLDLLNMSEALQKAVKEDKVTASTARKIEDLVKPERVNEIIESASDTSKGKKGKTIQVANLPDDVVKEEKKVVVDKEKAKKEVSIPKEESIPADVKEEPVTGKKIKTSEEFPVPVFEKELTIENDTDIVITSCKTCVFTTKDQFDNDTCMFTKFFLNKVISGQVHSKCPLRKIEYFVRLKT